MVSKNNHQFYQQKHAERKQRWGVRKLSVGVASVLLGTTFMLHSNHAVSANTVVSDATPSTTTQADNKGTGTEGTTYTLQTSGDSTATTDKGQDKTSTTSATPTSTDKQASDQNVNQQAPATNADSQAKKAVTTDEKTDASTGKDQKVTSPQPAPVQKMFTRTASTDAVADYTPATPTTDKAGVTTGVYNNPLVTSSDWIKMTHGDAIGYYTAKGKDGKTYVTGYAAAKGNSQSIFNVDQIDANSLEFHLLYHNGDKEVNSGLWFNFADGKTLQLDTSRLGADGPQLKSQQGQSYKWAIHTGSDGGTYYNSWAEYLKAHNNVGDQASEISMTGVALKPDDTIEFNIPVKYIGQLSARTPSLRFEQDIDDYGSGFNRSSASLYFTTVKKDLSKVKQVVLLPTEFMGEQPGQSNWKLVKEIVKDMPNGRETIKISNFPIFKGSFNTELPKGDLPPVVYGTAQYFIDLSQIQKIFANHGYTVKYANNNGKAQEMPFYAYVTLPLALIDGDGKPVDPSIWTIQVQAVPAIILNKDQHYVADPNKPWDTTSMIDEIYAADDAGQRKTRDQLEKLPKTDVDISYEYQAPGAATAVAVDKVDLTKAGVYTVTYSHTYADGQVVKDSRKVYVDDVKQETKDITRTIIVHTPNGTDQTVIQKATLTREVILDATTGEIKSAGKWSTAKWETYSAPEFKGYTPDVAQVEEATVTKDTQDTTVEINYTANKPTTPEQNNDQGQKPQTNDQGQKPQTVEQVTKTGKDNVTVNTRSQAPAPVAQSAQAQKLPHTGEAENRLGVLGVLTATLGMLGLGWKKRERQ
ncbi:mucin-binding protein [Ligilactobacillus saerimneri]|uniref:mucin-binding protein n=1 Tax=Ligilactobacillus saerimneri TaxID=228229 RepID=UPI0024B929DC|nr:YSIRK-type signal peptide-containing protein [Ligilactobacillus saerimneri]